MKKTKKTRMSEKRGKAIKKGLKILAVACGILEAAKISYNIGIDDTVDLINELLAKGFLDATLPSGGRPATPGEWHEKVKNSFK